MSVKVGIVVKGFDIRMDAQPDGSVREVHLVEYGPIGSLDRTTIVARLSDLSRVGDAQGDEDNIAIQQAKARWDVIGPAYENWKAGRAAVDDGTPLAAWNRISRAQADKMILNGVRSVEAIAALTDTHIDRFGIPGLRDIIIDAKRFLAAQETNAVQAQMRAKDEQINNLVATVEQMQEQMRAFGAQQQPAKRGPGRPPKAHDEEEAA